MRRIKSKIYKWISSIPHRNMEDKETEPISGSPAKSLPLTDWKKAFPMLSRYSSNRLMFPKNENDKNLLSSFAHSFPIMEKNY